MKIRFLLVSAFAIAMGYGAITISECCKRYDAYTAALNDIRKTESTVYIDLGIE